MNQIILSELAWEVKQYDTELPDQKLPDLKGQWFPSDVPGAIHYDLVAAGKLENPYSSASAAFASEWVAKSDWIYKTEFETPHEINKMKTILLRFEGVDTYSEIWLNEELIGLTANAHRVYDFSVNHSIFAVNKKNTLLVRLKSHVRMITSKIDETEKHLKNGKSPEGTLGKSLIRRYQRSFYAGSSLLNLGTGVLGMGIVRKVSLLSFAGPYIKDLSFRTVSISKIQSEQAQKKENYCCDYSAECMILLSVFGADENTHAQISLFSPAGIAVYEASFRVKKADMEIPLPVKNADLWWPKGYGNQNLYTLDVKITQGGFLTDEVKQLAGIKKCELVTKDEKGKNTFYLKINGKKIIIHGQNLIPLDYIKSYRCKEEYMRVFDMLENQYVNMVRIWGGGVIEEDYFYEECDRRGIMLFQDFFLHSNQYPDYDKDWTDEFLEESEEMLRRVRKHPSLCIICGGNETIEGWECWGWKQSPGCFNGERLIKQDLPSISSRLCPELPYIENSPHGGLNCQSPSEGESHIWGNFYNSTKDPLFVTETCWTQESYSRPPTLKKYMDLNVDDFSCQLWAEKWRERTGLGLINRYPYSDLFESGNLKSYLHSLEVEQMRADYNALNMFRFASPNNNGVMYWSFNKGGPLFQFGCVDYGGYPMMSYYAVKRVFSPLAVFARRDIKDISVMLSNHSPHAYEVKTEIFHLDKEGHVLGYWAEETNIKHGELEEIRLKNLYEKIHERTGEIIYVCAATACKLTASDMLFFCSYNEFEQISNPLKIKHEKMSENIWLVYIETEYPVRMVELESNQKLLFSDNYFPMIPQKGITIEINLLEKTKNEGFTLSVGVLGSEKIQNFTLSDGSL